MQRSGPAGASLRVVVSSLGPHVLRVVDPGSGLDREAVETVLHDPGAVVTAGSFVLAVGVVPGGDAYLSVLEGATAGGAVAVAVKAGPEVPADALLPRRVSTADRPAVLAVEPSLSWDHLYSLLRSALSVAGSRLSSPQDRTPRAAPLGDLYALANATAAAVGGAVLPEPSSAPRVPTLEASLEAEADALDEPVGGGGDGNARRAVGLARRRWLWVAAFFFGATTISFNTVLSLFFEDVYGTGPFGRGALIAVATVGTLLGLAVGAPLTERDDRRRGTPGLVSAMTRALVLFTVSIVVIGSAPVLLLSGLGVVLASIGVGLLLVAFYPLINRSSPAGKRSRTFALITFTAGLGAIASTPLFTIGDNLGYRATLLALAGLSAVMAFASWRLGRDQVRYAEAPPPVLR